MRPPAGGCPKPTIRITEWKRVSIALEEVDTPPLNNISNVFERTDEIDSAIGALTNHISTVVKRCSRVVPAEIIGIPKSEKPRDVPARYRPIILLSGLGKIYEKILKTRLSEYLFGKGLIINEKFRFRPKHSCPPQ
ncbi:hypothetical protein EVAR_9292_1 [Eumeta japonica]|uniref:RNA-directed DNA polymerase from transposon X-element n=1 Tax=Eumeta variegata TaxID=151549 RepID=A0A4C1TMX8_EUMVA|nr:hypothetical protein EVAR_9292_1 [Eumeta japonica]